MGYELAYSARNISNKRGWKYSMQQDAIFEKELTNVKLHTKMLIERIIELKNQLASVSYHLFLSMVLFGWIIGYI